VSARFPLSMRLLHWLMAAMVLTMLFIGLWMVNSLSAYHRLVSIHRPLGILVLLLVVVRFINRRRSTLPPFPPTMSRMEQRIAHVSELLLYSLMFAMPLIGWGMLSAGSVPIVLYGPLRLPSILPANPMLYTVLRKAHTIFAYALLLTILAHLTAVLFHTLVVRDGLLDRMSVWNFPGRKRAEPQNHHRQSAAELIAASRIDN
jgi:cytochrome b561